jgi:hypothetical protein
MTTEQQDLALDDQPATLPDIPFAGAVYDPTMDDIRLSGQLLRIWHHMDGELWQTLTAISIWTATPEASVSAQLRHLKKARFGSHTVNKRRRGGEKSSQWEYQVIRNKATISRLRFAESKVATVN